MFRTPKTKVAMDIPYKPATRPRWTRWLIVGLTALLGVALAAAGYFYYQYRNSPAVKDEREIRDLTKTIGGLMILPEKETPTLATVTDKEKLVDQPFFAKAENGDKVLIYSQSGRAVLYRPSLKKIVDVTSVNVTPPAGTTSAAETPPTPNPPQSTATTSTNPVRIALYNGSGEKGVVASVQKEILGLYPNTAMSAIAEANREYANGTVVDLSGNHQSVVQALATLIKANVGALPEGESAPSDADILVIIGKSH